MALEHVVRRAIHLHVQDPASGGAGYHNYLAQRDGETPFGDLLLAVFNSILEVFILCAAGYILARQGILDKKTQKQINRLNVSLFTPALLFSKVAFYLTPEKLKELWVIPIWFMIVTLTSMAVGRVLGWSFGLRKSQRSFIMAAAMFMNSNALPIALMQSLVTSVPDLAWGSDDNKNAMLGRALTYLTMYSTLGMVVRYSYGVSLLSRADTILTPATIVSSTVTPSTSILGLDTETGERTPLLVDFDDDETEAGGEHDLKTHPSTSTLVHSTSTPKDKKGKMVNHFTESPTSSVSSSPRIGASGSGADTGAGITATAATGGRPPRLTPGRRNTTFYNSFPNSPNESRADLPAWGVNGSSGAPPGIATDGRMEHESDSEEEEDEVAHNLDRTAADLEHGTHHRDAARPPSSFSKFVSSVSAALQPVKKYVLLPITSFLLAVHAFMTVPLYAALLSLIVALTPPLQYALEHNEVLRPVNGAIGTCGKCAVPITLVVLGGYFWSDEDGAVDAKDKAKKKKKPKKDRRSYLQRVKEFLHISTSEDSGSTPTIEPGKKPGETKTVMLSILARMIITPLVLTPLMVMATMSDWHAVFEDPVFVVVNTLLLCSPPALTLAQITSAGAGGGSFERLISRTIFWSYCVMTPVVMLGSVLGGLWLAEL
ncbi:putative transporter [Psilocybe cubensis]|uniref:Transporter n=1 Tax=Psilocybe cubensis TaxID=181762 RepID=A0ACB8GR62_PSICU|nr:putative transporter [Psilocybe cubensis]KAH9478161.1 putative transporter [Psilocybe cubensis]